MIFGIKQVRNDLGEFSSDKCSACKNSETYHFFKITRFFVVFFLNLIPLGSRYEAVCSSCNDTLTVDAKSGRSIAKKNFRKRSFALGARTVLKLAAAAVVLTAAIVLPLTLRFPLDTKPETLKGLITETADGLYGIQDRDGNVLAIVQLKEGEKTITFYDDVSVLVKEPGADGSFRMHEYRQEATNDAKQDGIFLVRIPDNPGVLLDRYKTPVRAYHYDSETDAFGYSTGVNDLTSIVYTADKVTYPYVHYTSESAEPSKYMFVLYITADKQIQATFFPDETSGEFNQLISLAVSEIKNGYVQNETQYVLGDKGVSDAKAAALTPQSSVNDILNFIAQNKPEITMATSYEYFENSKVVSSMTFSLPDENGTMQSVTQPFTVTVKNGYYIVKADEQAQ